MNHDSVLVATELPVVKLLPTMSRIRRTMPTAEQVSKSPPGSKLIPLTKGKFSIVDEADYEDLMRFNWHFQKRGYAARNATIGEKRVVVKMHRQIMNAPEGFDVDHLMGNRLDNRRSQLRLATRSENCRNTGPHRDNVSGLKGVTYFKARKIWQSRIWHLGVQYHLGYHSTPKAAHAAYCDAAAKLHGEFARVA